MLQTHRLVCRAQESVCRQGIGLIMAGVEVRVLPFHSDQRVVESDHTRSAAGMSESATGSGGSSVRSADSHAGRAEATGVYYKNDTPASAIREIESERASLPHGCPKSMRSRMRMYRSPIR